MAEVAIDVRGLCADLGHQRVLSDVTFAVTAGEFVGITGPNGGGKSTLLRAMLGLTPTSGGHVTFFGQTLAAFQREGTIGYVPQHAAHVEQGFPATATEVVAMGLTKRWPWQGNRPGAVAKALAATGVTELAKRRVTDMSGGQRQRVLLAKALVTDPRLLILDEPTTGVDAPARDAFAHLLADLNRDQGTTVLLVSHDADLLHHAAGRLLVVDHGLAADVPASRMASTLEQLHGGSHGHP